MIKINIQVKLNTIETKNIQSWHHLHWRWWRVTHLTDKCNCTGSFSRYTLYTSQRTERNFTGKKKKLFLFPFFCNAFCTLSSPFLTTSPLSQSIVNTQLQVVCSPFFKHCVVRTSASSNIQPCPNALVVCSYCGPSIRGGQLWTRGLSGLFIFWDSSITACWNVCFT